MIALLAALSLMFVFIGGGLLEHGEVALALAFTALGAIGNGTLFAAVQAKQDADAASIEVKNGLNLTQLWLFLNNRVELTGDTKLYVGDRGLNPAGAVFTCVLDGQRVVVIERKEEITKTAEQLF